MNKTSMNLQDLFLNQVRKESVPVTIYLVSGVQLKGVVRGFDAFTLVLESPGKPPQLVYKHAMASIVPARMVYTSGPREERQPELQEQPQPEPPQPDPQQPDPPQAEPPQPDPQQPDPPQPDPPQADPPQPDPEE